MANVCVLRLLRPDDRPALADLWVASWQEAMPAIDFEARRTWILAFLERTDSLVTIVALDAAQRACGFVTIEPASVVYLHQLVVAPAAKGAGVATALLDHAKTMAGEGLALDVNQANTRAVRFYERSGFQRESAGVNPASGLATWRLRWSCGSS